MKFGIASICQYTWRFFEIVSFDVTVLTCIFFFSPEFRSLQRYDILCYKLTAEVGERTATA